MRTINKQEIQLILNHLLKNAPYCYQVIKEFIDSLDDSFYCSELFFKSGRLVNCVEKTQLTCVITNDVTSYIIEDEFNDDDQYLLSYHKLSNIEDEDELICN